MKDKHIAKKYLKDISTPMGDSGDILKKYPNLIDFSLGDPDVTTPELIIEKAFEDAKAGHTHYTNFYGDDEFIEEIVKFYQEEYQYKIETENIMVTTSACHGMWLVLEAILDEGDEVIIPDPYFTPYPNQVELCGGKPVFVPTFEEDGFQLDIEELEKKITPKTKALLINTPNNPTGACLTKERLIDIGHIAEKHDLVIIADDIYTLLSYDTPFVPINTLENFFDRTITLRSFSKDYAMTGWRLGYVIADPKLIKIIKDINENNVFTAPSISQRAGLHALRNRAIVQPPLIKEFKARTMHTYKRINRLKNMSMEKPRGTFYLFPNIKETGLNSQEVADRLLKEAEVLVLPGSAFGEAGEGYLRFAVCMNIEQIDQAFDRIETMDLFKPE